MRHLIVLLLIGFSACSLSDVDNLRLKKYNGRVLYKYHQFDDERHVLELTKGIEKDTVDFVIKNEFYYLPIGGGVHKSRMKSVSYVHFKYK